MAAPPIPIEDSPTPRRLVPPTVSGAQRRFFTAAGALDQANGVIGACASGTPTAAQIEALMLQGGWSAADNVREVIVALTDYSGKAAGALRLTVNAGEQVIAADRLLGGQRSMVRVLPGDKDGGLGPTDKAITTFAAVFWFAGGTGYDGIEAEIVGVAYA